MRQTQAGGTEGCSRLSASTSPARPGRDCTRPRHPGTPLPCISTTAVSKLGASAWTSRAYWGHCQWWGTWISKAWQVVMLISGKRCMASLAQRWKAGPWGGRGWLSTSHAACGSCRFQGVHPEVQGFEVSGFWGSEACCGLNADRARGRRSNPEALACQALLHSRAWHA